jgi:sec-independent protein translocase protein TatA
MNLGMGEILVLLALALLLFGAKRLPEIGRSAGSAIREFKKGFESGEPEEGEPEEKEKEDRGNKREE